MEAYNSYMKINKYFLCATGLWPYQSKFTQNFCSFFIWLSLISFLIPQILALVNNWDDSDVIIQWLPPCFVNLLSISCFVPASINRKRIEIILTKMKEDWLFCESDGEFEILKDNGVLAKTVNNTIYVFFYVAMLEFLTVPLIPSILDAVKPLNESRPRRLIIITDYLVDSNEDKYYAAIAAHHWHVSIVTITLILTVDGIFRAFIYHAAGQLEILGFKMRNLVNIDYNMDISDEKNVQKKIKFCVEKHKSVLTFINQINDCFSTSYFMGLGFNMIMISFTGVQLIMRLDDPSETFAILSYTLSQVLRLFSLTLPCQRLMDKSMQLSQNIYDSYWYNLTPSSKNMLRIIMLRCIKPSTFTAGKLYIFSMSNFGSVVKTSISYFTVLLSVRE